ncbi:hypothetical protein OG594_44895 [Streptomyces sp. NBC_01214]|uniref:hypothetical protein n=1 Tax=Streptomyces sp. NBC_01214 TaxID=2903777 RepID=UPI00225515E6|nr:hypothetical protein [Streptomyces sp. NBC_01214]MCX4808637.1 hypothetical protein [Streptomyces sp. NBC_01214]
MQDQVTAYLDKREFDIAYRRATAGGGLPSMALPDVLVAVTLAPFITAVAASLGSGLGGRIETVALRILRRVPRPAILNRSSMFLDAGEEPGDPTEEDAADESRSALTVTAEGGTRIQLSTYTPVEALTLLPAIDFTEVQELGDVPTTVRWISDSWHAVSIKDGQIADAAWNPATRQWVTTPF